jgi:hypothetical protein
MEKNALAKAREEVSHFLESETTGSIRASMYRALVACDLSEVQTENYMKSLDGDYRYIDEISELRRGVFTRWLGLDRKKLVNGGIALDIDPCASGSMIVSCKNFSGQIFRYDFNRAITFQKLTPTEKTILKISHLHERDDA